MMSSLRNTTWWATTAVLLGWCIAVPANAQSMKINHDPVPFAVRGQPLTLKAKVTSAEAPQSVTLYYALFRDAAPFRVPMKSTGLGYYVGTIDAGMMSGVDSISYYIEAQDNNGAITETPWYDVEFRAPESKPATVMPAPGPAAPAPVIPVPQGTSSQGPESSWRTPALVAGGAAVVLGGAYLIAGGGGGGGGGDGGGTPPADPSGTYNGSVTTCFTATGGTTKCDSHAMSILIDSQGTVFSETIHPGQQLTASLNSDSAFALIAQINEGGTNGAIRYEGNVVGQKIIGSVSGGATTPGGSGSYSGTFSANKQ